MYSSAHQGSLDIKEYEDYEEQRAEKKKPSEKKETRSATEVATEMWQRIKGKK